MKSNTSFLHVTIFTMVSVHEIYDNIVNAWRRGEEKTLYEMHRLMETTFNPMVRKKVCVNFSLCT